MIHKKIAVKALGTQVDNLKWRKGRIKVWQFYILPFLLMVVTMPLLCPMSNLKQEDEESTYHIPMSYETIILIFNM